MQTFNGSTVLLTGATGAFQQTRTVALRCTQPSARLLNICCAPGYVGALVLEQLFRTCPGIRKVSGVSEPSPEHAISTFRHQLK